MFQLICSQVFIKFFVGNQGKTNEKHRSERDVEFEVHSFVNYTKGKPAISLWVEERKMSLANMVKPPQVIQSFFYCQKTYKYEIKEKQQQKKIFLMKEPNLEPCELVTKIFLCNIRLKIEPDVAD